MMMSNRDRSYPQRQTIRLNDHDYATPGAYFVTICTHGRLCILGHIADETMMANALGEVVRQGWQSLQDYHPVSLDAFVLMPNHIHGVVVLRESPGKRCALPNVIRTFKSMSARRINELRCMTNVPVWQRGYYEHVIRNDHALEKIRRYIVGNPGRWRHDLENPDVNDEPPPRAGRRPAPTADRSQTARLPIASFICATSEP
jgi:REP element-mobilizing transposase RayT